jgi:hypothetical protein
MRIENEFRIWGYFVYIKAYRESNYLNCVDIPKTPFSDLVAFLLGGKSEFFLKYGSTHSYTFPNRDSADHFCFLLKLDQQPIDDYIPF